MTKIILLSLISIFVITSVAFAQTDADLDENITAQDLDIGEPRVLPGSFFYPFKNLGRAIKSLITRDPVKKAELKLKFADEKLIEAKMLAQKTDKPEVLEKAAENYEQEIEKIKTATDKIKQKADKNPKVGKFLDKFIKHQILHQKILEKLGKQVPEKAFEKIKATREKHLQRFGEVMQKLENKEKIQERLEKNLEQVKGSKFKHFKHLQILKQLEEKAPEEIKDTIRKTQENRLRKFKAKLEQMSTEEYEKFEDYAEKAQEDPAKKIEILEDIKTELKAKPEMRKKLEKTRKRILEKNDKISHLNLWLPDERE